MPTETNKNNVEKLPLPTLIRLDDIATVVNIIDVCSQRGAFQGSELLEVGQLRERFAAFVKENRAQASQQPSTPTADAPAPNVEATDDKPTA